MNTEPSSLLNFFEAQNAEIDVVWFIVHFLLAALLSYLLSKVYVHFGNALSNREMFGRNFMILSMTTMLIITIVKSSVALSLGLVGALSIIRFRAAIKEPEELSYLFFAIAIGLGMGSQQALITGVAFLVLVAILAMRHYTRSDESKPNLYLTLSGIKTEQDYLPEVIKILSREARDHRLRRMDETGELYEISFQIQFRDIEHIQTCRAALTKVHPEMKISLMDDRGIGG